MARTTSTSTLTVLVTSSKHTHHDTYGLLAHQLVAINSVVTSQVPVTSTTTLTATVISTVNQVTTQNIISSIVSTATSLVTSVLTNTITNTATSTSKFKFSSVRCLIRDLDV